MIAGQVLMVGESLTNPISAGRVTRWGESNPEVFWSLLRTLPGVCRDGIGKMLPVSWL